MARNAKPENNYPASLLPEIGPDGLLRDSPVIAYTEKIIEKEQLQLRKYIDENYSKIREVEHELANLSLEMKLTAGPKKAALELMRKKIETSTEITRLAKLKAQEAKQAWEAAAKAVEQEKDNKNKLCGDLNNLVKEGSKSQLSRLEELRRRLEALNPGRSSTYVRPEDNQKPAAAATTAEDSPLAPTISERVGDITEVSNTRTYTKDHNQQPFIEAQAPGRKKNNIHGKVRGIGAVPKGRGPAATGWTGAGFDVDGRAMVASLHEVGGDLHDELWGADISLVLCKKVQTFCGQLNKFDIADDCSISCRDLILLSKAELDGILKKIIY